MVILTLFGLPLKWGDFPEMPVAPLEIVPIVISKNFGFVSPRWNRVITPRCHSNRRGEVFTETFWGELRMASAGRKPKLEEAEINRNNTTCQTQFMSKLNDCFLTELADIYDAENQLTQALQKMSEARNIPS